jgi:hypothetical protein
MHIPPKQPLSNRLSDDDLEQMRGLLASARVPVCSTAAADQKLRDLRRMYEPYINGFSERLLMPYPAWKAAAGPADNWKTSAWEKISSQSAVPLSAMIDEEHR